MSKRSHIENSYIDAISKQNKKVKHEVSPSKTTSKRSTTTKNDEEVLSKRWKNLENYVNIKKDPRFTSLAFKYAD